MYERAVVKVLRGRMEEPLGLMQVLVGPRQTGKSTALKQASADLSVPVHSVSADFADQAWLRTEWQQARNLVSARGEALLIVDEVQKIEGWSAVVKELWDEDRRGDVNLKVFLSGSSSLLLSKGLDESLMGRFEMLYCLQWTYAECREAFGYSLNEFIYFGGYPRSASFVADEDRWRRFMRESIIEPTISQDVLALAPIKKPALMRALFTLGVQYSAQELSYTKMLGQLQDAGNTVTLAEYLNLLSLAGMLSGLQKFDMRKTSSRKSSPRLMAHDSSLQSAMLELPRKFIEMDRSRWGHLVETAVGAYLINRGREEGFEVFWWREGAAEVDFVLRKGELITAIEVKSGAVGNLEGMEKFLELYPKAYRIVVGSPEVSLEDFLLGKVDLFLL
ncbi:MULTISPECIES: ATP-binding protein [Gordonibacter]|uniref:AAA family ATPase n=1 Tax=Gordonibacter faecis TaxID=3047475 RepID=A0ABT7DNU5_9ACTN|nr:MULTISPECIES: AAA family ATPase [unclassified Gordonibacter]MDJ1651210.1 AAA family ATPase [Gordonibacter sp. KGMB12511]HIW77325.1 AAA family ATPase [Candidatus Gordonibacter avicola]